MHGAWLVSAQLEFAGHTGVPCMPWLVALRDAQVTSMGLHGARIEFILL